MWSVKADVDAIGDVEVEAASHLLLSTRGAALLARDMDFLGHDGMLSKKGCVEWATRAAD